MKLARRIMVILLVTIGLGANLQCAFAQDEQIPQKPTKAANSAKVIIDFPSSLKSQSNYFNIAGPVWVFTIKFRELNGIGAIITKKQMRIYDKKGNVWGDSNYISIYDSESGKDVELNLQPNSTASYTSWVNSPSCDLCGAKMVLEYVGKDKKDNPIKISGSFIMEK